MYMVHCWSPFCSSSGFYDNFATCSPHLLLVKWHVALVHMNDVFPYGLKEKNWFICQYYGVNMWYNVYDIVCMYINILCTDRIKEENIWTIFDTYV